FQSRRAPMCATFGPFMGFGVLGMEVFLAGELWIARLSALLPPPGGGGLHGILGRTAPAAFRRSCNTPVGGGVIGRGVFLRTALPSIILGELVPNGGAAKNAGNWLAWPLFLLPFATIGFFLTLRIWNALPQRARDH